MVSDLVWQLCFVYRQLLCTMRKTARLQQQHRMQLPEGLAPPDELVFALQQYTENAWRAYRELIRAVNIRL